MQRQSVLLGNKEIQIETSVTYHIIHTNATKKIEAIKSVGGELEHLYTVDGNVKWYMCCVKHFDRSLKYAI